MLKLDGNRTLAHSEGNELDQTMTHVAGYLPVRVAQLVISTAHSSQKNVTMPSAICSLYWCLAGSEVWAHELLGEFQVCRIVEDDAHCNPGSIRARQFRIFQKFLEIFPRTPCSIY